MQSQDALSEKEVLNRFPLFSIRRDEVGHVVEYRIDQINARQWNGKVFVFDMLFYPFISYALFFKSSYFWWAAMAVLGFRIQLLTSTVLSESVTFIPGIGLQLQVHSGIAYNSITAAIPLTTSRKLIPLNSILDIIINEALQGWRVQSYLAIICTRSQSDSEEVVKVEPVFTHGQPPFPVSREIYHGLRENVFDEWSDSSSNDSDNHEERD